LGKIKQILNFLAFFLILGGIFLLSRWPVSSNGASDFQANASDSLQLASQPEVATMEVHESDFNIDALSAISVEFGNNVEDKVLFGKDAEKKLPIASLAKLMTALVVLENYNLDQQVVISKSAMEQVGEQGKLIEGEVLSVENLLYIMLVESSNRAAYAISEILGKDSFISLMNKEALEIGLHDTYFDDSTGLSSQTYSTVENLVKLSKYLFINYPLFNEIIGLKEYNLYLPGGILHHKLINTNELLGQDNIVGGKTGYTYEAGGCFIVIQKKEEGRYVVHIVLGAEDRLLQMYKLIKKSSDIQSQKFIGG